MEEDHEEDPEFPALLQELWLNLSVDEYIESDESVPTAQPYFDTVKLGWRHEAWLKWIDRVKRTEAECDEVISEESESDN